MNNYYFTFGMNQSLHNNYVKIKADNEEAARRTMRAHYGQLWAFCYNEEDFEGQPEEYRLEEVKLGTPNYKRY